MKNVILTVDIGGSFIKAAIYDEEGHCISPLPEELTTIGKNGNDIAGQIARMYFHLSGRYPISGIALASAGIIDPYEGVIEISNNIPHYSGTPLKAMTESSCGVPCSLENDVNALALGEYWQGAARGGKTVLCVSIGTGLGGAVLSDGKILHGSHFTAGEIGLLPLADGKFLEEKASTTALLADYAQRSGEEIDGRQFFARFSVGDHHAMLALDQMLDHLTDGLLPALYLLAPDIVLLGGGIAAAEIVELKFRHMIAEKLPLSRFMPKTICCAALGRQATMLGALRWFLDRKKDELES
ncbi:ROK family protein [Dichelobacter nodosus]|uniref:ROK family protein n=1 Tax=Dichelobacter nodosus (strain VCS1703A) TaxID=246195 RepID=A5EV46_DICNV|nr:ROK family protein [Dichelobacter nodosus]ABQ13376.1 ROK family protein [Dichelobacter nodosus VCS1703A]AXM45568.1 ROK family protein [Dichelobacter nodosus]KNZ38949.1 ROK family transcriptional regulator [Dichelobacter nodosus]TGA66253.1 ROK family protein [Dichelobacter nodosus]